METITISEAKSDLSHLLERVEAGENFVIVEAGRPVARLVAYEGEAVERVGGVWAGRVRVEEDFDEPLPFDAPLEP
jgi:prevent-host-death family protein